jgi:hypothetical protein
LHCIWQLETKDRLCDAWEKNLKQGDRFCRGPVVLGISHLYVAVGHCHPCLICVHSLYYFMASMPPWRAIQVLIPELGLPVIPARVPSTESPFGQASGPMLVPGTASRLSGMSFRSCGKAVSGSLWATGSAYASSIALLRWTSSVSWSGCNTTVEIFSYRPESLAFRQALPGFRLFTKLYRPAVHGGRPLLPTADSTARTVPRDFAFEGSENS